MPFALAIIGIMIFVTAVKGTTNQLFGLVKDDFTGSGSYIWWIISILAIGSIGYVKALRPVSDGFLALVMVVLFIGAGNKGFFQQFINGIKQPGGCQSASANPLNPSGLTPTDQQALQATQAAPGAGYGLTMPPLPSGQIVPDPVAGGPM